MAEGPRMTAAQLADKLMSDEHADVLHESVAWMARELMEADVAVRIGAELGERSLERTTHRNGYRPRQWDTRVGSVELAIPKLRSGSYFPSFLEPCRRAEQALGGWCERGRGSAPRSGRHAALCAGRKTRCGWPG
jgi:putative transposase